MICKVPLARAGRQGELTVAAARLALFCLLKTGHRLSCVLLASGVCYPNPLGVGNKKPRRIGELRVTNGSGLGIY